MEWTSIATLVIGVCAIVSPILTAIINNHYQLKLRQLEYKMEFIDREKVRQKRIVEDYLEKASSCTHAPTLESQKDYCAAFSLASLYVPADTAVLMRNIHNSVFDGDINNATPTLNTIIQQVRETM